jgi:hypothetical protein
VASFYSRVLHRSNTGLRKEGEREVMARRAGKAGMHSRGAECSEGNNGRVGVEATLKGFCPYVGGEEVSWTGGHPGVHEEQ